MTHTPGPWWACPPDTDSGNWEVEDGYGHTATVYGDDVPAAANARLMAAAPELLRLLREGSSVVSSLEADCDEAGIDSQRARWWWQSVDKLFDKLEVE
jgi:hypothetical protein